MSRPKGSVGCAIVEYVRNEPHTTSADLVADLGLTLANASSTLRKLWAAGRLERTASSKALPARNGKRSGRTTVYVYTVRPGGAVGAA